MELITIVLASIASLIGSVLAALVAEDVKAWTPWLVDRLIRRAVRNLSEAQRERYDEEWRSHAEEVPGRIAKVFVALGFVRAARRMAANPGFRGALPKRMLDMGSSALGLLLSLPLLALLACAVRIDGRGPILLAQGAHRSWWALLLRLFVSHAAASGARWETVDEFDARDAHAPRPLPAQVRVRLASDAGQRRARRNEPGRPVSAQPRSCRSAEVSKPRLSLPHVGEARRHRVGSGQSVS